MKSGLISGLGDLGAFIGGKANALADKTPSKLFEGLPDIGAGIANQAGGFVAGAWDKLPSSDVFGTGIVGSFGGGSAADEPNPFGIGAGKNSFERYRGIASSSPNEAGAWGTAIAQGGEWSTLDGYNDFINQAAQANGVPPNLIKAMLGIEGDMGNSSLNPVWIDGRSSAVSPFTGIFEETAISRGLDWNRLITDHAYAIDGMAKVLKAIYNDSAEPWGKQGSVGENWGWQGAITRYFAGDPYDTGWSDELGTSINQYLWGGRGTMRNWNLLDQASGGSGQWGGDPQRGSEIVEIAQTFVGVPYVWGSLPSKDQDPWKTGWDCSAFVNWLDDKYGADEIVAGSHYQYQQAQQQGKLFTNQGQLQAGDLVWFDTGLRGGGGAELNNASHVGMYIGNGQFINAANPEAGTIISNMSDPYWSSKFLGARHMSWSGQGPINGGGGGFGGGYFDPTKAAWFNILKYGRYK